MILAPGLRHCSVVVSAFVLSWSLILFSLDLEVTKLEFILRLNIKRNDWLLADTSQKVAKS